MIFFVYAGGRMGSVSQNVALPSHFAHPTLATKCVLNWTSTAVPRAATATGGVEIKFEQPVLLGPIML